MNYLSKLCFKNISLYSNPNFNFTVENTEDIFKFFFLLEIKIIYKF